MSWTFPMKGLIVHTCFFLRMYLMRNINAKFTILIVECSLFQNSCPSKLTIIHIIPTFNKPLAPKKSWSALTHPFIELLDATWFLVFSTFRRARRGQGTLHVGADRYSPVVLPSSSAPSSFLPLVSFSFPHPLTVECRLSVPQVYSGKYPYIFRGTRTHYAF